MKKVVVPSGYVSTQDQACVDEFRFDKALPQEVINLSLDIYKSFRLKALKRIVKSKTAYKALHLLEDAAKFKALCELAASFEVKSKSVLKRLPCRLLSKIPILPVLRNVPIKKKTFCEMIGFHRDCLGKNGKLSRIRKKKGSIITDKLLGETSAKMLSEKIIKLESFLKAAKQYGRKRFKEEALAIIQGRIDELRKRGKKLRKKYRLNSNGEIELRNPVLAATSSSKSS